MPGSWVEFHPAGRAECAALGLTDPAVIVDLPGEVVSGHADRHVRRVERGGRVFYLKREHRVPLRTRWKHRREGFGWASKAAREAAVLTQLEAAGLPQARWLAHGESAGRAFLLLAESPGVEPRYADAGWGGTVGDAMAKLHEAGFDNPDLTAKHVLVAEVRVTFLDWQRGRRGPVDVPRALALLKATLPADGWADLRRHYGNIDEAEVDRAARRLKHRPEPAGRDLRLVWLDGEALCVVPERRRDFERPDVRAALDRAGPLPLPGVRFSTATYRCHPGRWLAALRGRSWRSPLMREVRLLAALHRAAVPAPRLLAFGQRLGPTAARAFHVTEPLAGSPAPRDCVNELIDRLHDAGIACGDAAPDDFAVSNGVPGVTDVRRLRVCRRWTPSRRRRDKQRLLGGRRWA